MQVLFIGVERIFLDEVDSTNSYANSLLSNVNLSEGLLVYTTNQTKGKGQRGSEWLAEKGSALAFTVVLKPIKLDTKKHFFLYIISALACYDLMTDVLNNSQIDIKIKWPNDILLNSKKVAGILIENSLQNGILKSSLIGVGINVSQGKFLNLPNATSIKIETKVETDITNILDKFCKYLEAYYLKLNQNAFQYLIDLYTLKLYKLQEFTNFEINGCVKRLKVNGISSTGLICLENESKQMFNYDIKEIKWVDLNKSAD
ncbi:MAG: biotin--[acetyl-CoA-carboxylase] ligase [Bacteroidetes bacterium]|nr:biotin--[acetyl-CoA-carboxylase] ligase [Bacteroidota bacterium]